MLALAWGNKHFASRSKRSDERNNPAAIRQMGQKLAGAQYRETQGFGKDSQQSPLW
jgi:hypothetical protein